MTSKHWFSLCPGGHYPPSDQAQENSLFVPRFIFIWYLHALVQLIETGREIMVGIVPLKQFMLGVQNVKLMACLVYLLWDKSFLHRDVWFSLPLPLGTFSQWVPSSHFTACFCMVELYRAMFIHRVISQLSFPISKLRVQYRFYRFFFFFKYTAMTTHLPKKVFS